MNPLLYGTRALNITLEHDRLGFSRGDQQRWLALSMVDGVDRFRDDTWTISFSDGALISIPVSAIDRTYIEHVRARGKTEHP